LHGAVPTPPPTHYVRSGDVDIAYQVFGEGDIDLVTVPSWVGNIELFWELAEAAHLLDGFARFSRVILFDKRGTGLSERTARVATIEERASDIGTVLDEVGSERAAIAGWADGAHIAAMFAAQHPERVTALVLGSFAAAGPLALSSEYRIDPEQVDLLAQAIAEGWGNASLAPLVAPSLAEDERFLTWFRKWERLSGTPSSALAELRWENDLDLRSILPTIRVPTMVLHRRDTAIVDRRAVEAAARLIPGAVYRELPGVDLIPVAGNCDEIIEEIEEFLTGSRRVVDADRVLATVLFTDIVSSTETAGTLGDRRWRDLLDAHHQEIRRCIDRFGGREIDTAGDGFLITFDGPARGVRCACAARDAVREVGLEIRAGLHTGEIEQFGNDVAGLAVHVGARVAALAGASEVLTTSTVKDLVLGSGIEFADRGKHALKGVPEPWQLFEVVRC
jgi:class 3 adenylate cyclase